MLTQVDTLVKRLTKLFTTGPKLYVSIRQHTSACVDTHMKRLTKSKLFTTDSSEWGQLGQSDNTCLVTYADVC
jgi:hypothetical protein